MFLKLNDLSIVTYMVLRMASVCVVFVLYAAEGACGVGNLGVDSGHEYGGNGKSD